MGKKKGGRRTVAKEPGKYQRGGAKTRKNKQKRKEGEGEKKGDERKEKKKVKSWMAKMRCSTESIAHKRKTSKITEQYGSHVEEGKG